MALTPTEKLLARDVGFDESICELIKVHGTLERLQLIDKGKFIEGPGISISVIDGEEAERVMTELDPKLRPRGYRGFWSERHEPNGMSTGHEIAILKTQSPYAIVKVRRSDGANYGITTQDILDRLESWAKRCRFDVVGADRSWVALQFTSLPEKICAFAEEIFIFCPDTVIQGVGLKRESEDSEAFREAKRLCPEISGAVHERNRGTFDNIPGMPESLRALLNSDALREETEMGVRLLARELRRTNYLFLWWD